MGLYAAAGATADGGFLGWVSEQWLAALEKTTWSDAAIFTVRSCVDAPNT